MFEDYSVANGLLKMWFKKLIALFQVLIFQFNSVHLFQCGVRKQRINEVIVRGQETFPGDWPWHAAIYHRNDYYNSYACGGTLISELFVLTAIHCVKSENGYVLSPVKVFVRLGVHYLQKLDPKTFQEHDVHRIHKYSFSKKLKNDIALLELATHVEFTTFVQPACVNQVEDLTRKFGTAVGWGIDETNKLSPVLKSATMPVVSGYQCLENNDGAFRFALDSSLFCAGFANGTNVCNGDSGGGLHFELSGIWYVGGIVSFTAPRDSSNLCHTESYAAFTNVYQFISWIRNVTHLQYLDETTSDELALGNTTCITPSNKSGFCVPIERCKNVYKIITNPNLNPHYDEYIKQAACILPEVFRSVCCQPPEIEPEPEVTLLPTNCGQTLKNRIFRGNTTKVFDHPWMAVLRYKNHNEIIDGCSGTIIHQRYVLTVAHCLKTRTTLVLDHVILGEHTKNNEIDCNIYRGPDGEEIERECAGPIKRYEVDSYVVHPNYNTPKFANDIGLIRLATDVTWEYHIQPICLPVTPQLQVKQFKEYVFTGWGDNGNGTSDVLQEATLPLVSNADCKQRMIENRLRGELSENQMCAGGENLANPCRGDAGGPLGVTTNYNGLRFVQFGVNSFGETRCNKQKVPNGFTRVASYMDWILQNIRP